MTEQIMTDHQRHLAEVEALQRDFDQAKSEWEQAKDKTAALKKTADAKQRRVWEYVRNLSKPLPLFDVWRQAPIDELGLADGITAILAEQGISTIGQLDDYTKTGRRLTDMPYIGEQKADAIIEALDRFWQSKRQTGEVD